MSENDQKFSRTSRWSFQTSLIFWLFSEAKCEQECKYVLYSQSSCKILVCCLKFKQDVRCITKLDCAEGCVSTYPERPGTASQKSLELLRIFSKSNLTRCHRDLWGTSDSLIILPNLLRLVMSKVLQRIIVVMRCQERPWSALCLSNYVFCGQKEIYLHFECWPSCVLTISVFTPSFSLIPTRWQYRLVLSKVLRQGVLERRTVKSPTCSPL